MIRDESAIELLVALPDEGEAPSPPAKPLATDENLAADGLVGPELYDGVDCAKLESYYRNTVSEELVEYTKPAPLQIVKADQPQPSLEEDQWQFTSRTSPPVRVTLRAVLQQRSLSFPSCTLFPTQLPITSQPISRSTKQS